MLGGGLPFRETSANRKNRPKETSLITVTKNTKSYLSQNNFMTQYRLRTGWIETFFIEKDLGILVCNKLNMSQTCTPSASRLTGLP